MVVASGMPPLPDMISFEVSAGPPDAEEASTDRTSGPAFRQPAQGTAARSGSSKRAEVRLTSHPRLAMLSRPHVHVRSLARAIIGAFTLRDVYRRVALLLRCWSIHDTSFSAHRSMKT